MQDRIPRITNAAFLIKILSFRALADAQSAERAPRNLLFAE
jgi:hypothetical protein